MTARLPDGSIAVGDVEAQTRQVRENIKSAVEAAGGTSDDCAAWMSTCAIEHFEKIQKIRPEYSKAPPPLPLWSRSQDGVTEYLIEINAIAVVSVMSEPKVIGLAASACSSPEGVADSF